MCRCVLCTCSQVRSLAWLRVKRATTVPIDLASAKNQPRHCEATRRSGKQHVVEQRARNSANEHCRPLSQRGKNFACAIMRMKSCTFQFMRHRSCDTGKTTLRFFLQRTGPCCSCSQIRDTTARNTLTTSILSQFEPLLWPEQWN